MGIWLYPRGKNWTLNASWDCRCSLCWCHRRKVTMLQVSISRWVWTISSPSRWLWINWGSSCHSLLSYSLVIRWASQAGLRPCSRLPKLTKALTSGPKRISISGWAKISTELKRRSCFRIKLRKLKSHTILRLEEICTRGTSGYLISLWSNLELLI